MGAKSAGDPNRPPDPKRLQQYIFASDQGTVNKHLAEYQKSMARFNELYGREAGNKTVSSKTGQGYGYQNPDTGKSFYMPKYTGGVQGPDEKQSNPSGAGGLIGWLMDSMARKARNIQQSKKYDAPDVENIKGV